MAILVTTTAVSGGRQLPQQQQYQQQCVNLSVKLIQEGNLRVTEYLKVSDKINTVFYVTSPHWPDAHRKPYQSSSRKTNLVISIQKSPCKYSTY